MCLVCFFVCLVGLFVIHLFGCVCCFVDGSLLIRPPAAGSWRNALCFAKKADHASRTLAW